MKLPFNKNAVKQKPSGAEKQSPMALTSSIPDVDVGSSEVIASTTPNDANVQDKLVFQAWYRMYENIERWRYALQYAENPILPQRLLLYRIYDEIMLDSTVISEIGS